MQTEAWKNLRRRVIKKFKKKCAACGNKGSHVHHITYERLFKEDMADFVLFCGRCHSLFHETYGVNKDMKDDTFAFIAEMKKHKATLDEADRLDREFNALW